MYQIHRRYFSNAQASGKTFPWSFLTPRKSSSPMPELGYGSKKLLPDNWQTIITTSRQLTLRLDFPFWVSEPLPGEKAFRFRWVFGLEQAI